MIDIQGVPADVGGYYKLDEDKANAVMRPSKVTLWFLTLSSATISQPEFAEIQRADGQLLNSPPAQSEIHCEAVINQPASSTHLKDTIIQFSAISNNCSIFAVLICHDQEQCANINNAWLTRKQRCWNKSTTSASRISPSSTPDSPLKSPLMILSSRRIRKLWNHTNIISDLAVLL